VSWLTNGTGRAVLKLGNVVYVGGGFTQVSSPDGTQQVNRSNLAAFDVRTGALIPSFVADTDGRVDDLLFDGTSLFVSGSFRTIGGASRTVSLRSIRPPALCAPRSEPTPTTLCIRWRSRLDASMWPGCSATSTVSPASGSPHCLQTPGRSTRCSPSVTGTVRTVAASPDASTVYIGGPYSAVDDTSTGARRWRHIVDGDVKSVHLIGSTVWSGFHDGANDDGSLRLLGYDLAAGAQDTRFRSHSDRFMGVWEVHGDTNALVVAGDFSTITGVAVEGLAIFPASGATNYAATVLGSQPWRYLDNGTDQGTAWRQPGFDDTTWRSGIGEFGYGDGGENTRVSFGTNAGDKYITTYLRTTFTPTGTPTTAGIYMRVDDGAVVYVNGIEAVRDNMPSGAIGRLTLALARDGADEKYSRHFPIDLSLIRPGTNTIAVEVRQATRTSDDLSFFRTLIAQAITIPPPTTTTTPTTTAPPTTSPPTTSPPPATISPSPPPPATRAPTPVENDVLDLRSALPWSIRRPGETTASGWTTASFDDRGWAYDTAPLGDVGAFQAARTQFTADPNRPLSLMVRAVPGATITAGTVGDARSPTTSRRARSRGISTLRVAPHSDTGARPVLTAPNRRIRVT